MLPSCQRVRESFSVAVTAIGKLFGQKRLPTPSSHDGQEQKKLQRFFLSFIFLLFCEQFDTNEQRQAAGDEQIEPVMHKSNHVVQIQTCVDCECAGKDNRR